MKGTSMEPFSCDTSVIIGTGTADGSVIFAKNSDRPANECQPLLHAPRRQWPAGSTVRCQYIAIPQVAETWEVTGSRPWWLWGFEMGVNEWGVTIGNEAVGSCEALEEAALIGMDLVRIALERATTADEAVEIIGALVEEYGQGGSCDYFVSRSYHNSYIVADPRGAWVLETAGHQWVAKRVTGRASISNLLSISDDWERGSASVVERARENGWAGSSDEQARLDFAAAYRHPTASVATGICRLDRARELTGAMPDPATVADMQRLLRDHYGDDLPRGAVERPSICMHLNPTFAGETAAAMVVQLRPDRPRELAVTCWTAFGSPCLSVFRPVYPFAVGLPEVLDRGSERFDAESPWWVFERLQRLVAQAPDLAGTVRAAFGELERRFGDDAAVTEEEAARHLAVGDRDGALLLLRALVDRTTRESIDLALTLTDELAPQVDALAIPAMVEAWREPNEKVGLELASATVAHALD